MLIGDTGTTELYGQGIAWVEATESKAVYQATASGDWAAEGDQVPLDIVVDDWTCTTCPSFWDATWDRGSDPHTITGQSAWPSVAEGDSADGTGAPSGCPFVLQE